MYLSSFDGTFVRIYINSSTLSEEISHLITKYRPLKQLTANNARKLDLIDDHFRYVGTVDWHQALVSFFRTRIVEIPATSRRSIIPSAFRASRSYTMKDDLWHAKASFTNSADQIGHLQINHESFKLVCPDPQTQHLVIYRIPNPFSGFYRTTYVDSNVVVGRVVVQSAQSIPNFHITLHQSVPPFLPILLSFLLNCFAATNFVSATQLSTPVQPEEHSFNDVHSPLTLFNELTSST